MVALVDDEDFEELNKYKWNAHKSSRSKNTYYAVRHILAKENPKRPMVSMHATIMGTKGGFEIDHFNGNGLDNQKHNLRHTTHQVNGQNLHMNKSSAYVGVYWHKKANKWQAQGMIKGIRTYLGLFMEEIKAHEAYINALQRAERSDIICQ